MSKRTARFFLAHLEGVFLRREEPLVVPPALDEREAARLAGGVRQRVHHILQIKRKAKILIKHSTFL